ncbi:spermatogenesis-associated serine-rich protein 1 isoform X2 [Paramormyrops kingsleyae]|uniref:Spermatogenesis associated serine rich 1 n=2 Tax=Paramormyrops kingsleyae TaxID=1676925 RepID=A0A3B3T196_9TELE|nr:spermatogenesis-associated serine-rich protein 1 isoform X2 [Paramormyrops kingsleyae]
MLQDRNTIWGSDEPSRGYRRRHFTETRGREAVYKPHIRHMQPNYTECDLDWKSRLRRLPQPRYGDAPFPHIKAIKFPEEIRLLRSFPNANMVSGSEWTFYPNLGHAAAFHVGKRCLFDGTQHRRSMRSSSHTSLESVLGQKKRVRSSRHPDEAAKPYLNPEYTTDFHKYGTTLPAIGFGSSATLKADTFVALSPPLAPACMCYGEKEKIKQREAHILEVKQLSEWNPAASVFDL